METNTQVAVLNPKLMEVSEKLNITVLSVIGQESIAGFQKAYIIANAIKELKETLTQEYMAPIMELQGNKLGFKSDKVYTESEVKNCLIEAVLIGLQPFNNEFNIIAGNMYPTKEGMGALLKRINGLTYEIVAQIPRLNATETSAAIVMKIRWKHNEKEEQARDIEIPIKVNKGMGTDAIIGKATRKARAWLFYNITGNEIADGDVNDSDAKTAATKLSDKEVEEKRERQMINDCKTLEDLDFLLTNSPDMNIDLINAKRAELKAAKA